MGYHCKNTWKLLCESRVYSTYTCLISWMEDRLRRFIILCGMLLVGAMAVLGDDSAAEKLAEGGHWKRLRALEEPRVAANSNDADAVYYLGRAKMESRDLESAVKLAEKAVALSPNSSRAHLLVADVAIQMAQNAGIFKGLGLAHRFREEAEKAIALDPKNLDAREDLMEFYFDAPGIGGGDKKKAYAMAEEIGQINATRGLLAKANLAGKEKNPAKQEELYKKALEAGPKDGEVLSSAAVFYSSEKQKKYDLAERFALEALKLDETRSAAYVALTMAYANSERWADLDQAMARCEKNVPDDFGAHYQTGKVLLNSGKDLPRAERYFRKYLTMEPEGGEPPLAAAHWRMGLVLEKEGKRAEAIAEIEEAVRLDANLKEAKNDLKRMKR
jgi:tetratricopeptide (TPR) repeat protein